jgi:hypothetical protein
MNPDVRRDLSRFGQLAQAAATNETFEAEYPGILRGLNLMR